MPFMIEEPKKNKTTLILISIFVVLSSLVLIFYGEGASQIGGIFMLVVYGVMIFINWHQKKQKGK